MKKSTMRTKLRYKDIAIDESRREIAQRDRKIERLEKEIAAAKNDIQRLYAENEKLYHTPEFAADTKSAVDRGRQEGIRSISQRAQNDMLAMLNDMYVEMERIAHKYTRDLTFDIFTDNVEPPQDAKSLPDTEFASKLVREAEDL